MGVCSLTLLLSACDQGKQTDVPTVSPQTTPTNEITTTPATSPAPETAIPTGKSYTIRYVSSTSLGGYITGNTEQTVRKGEKTTVVTAVANEGYKFLYWSDGIKNPERNGDTTSYDKELTAMFVLDVPEFSAPTINIVTSDKEPVLSKEYTTAVISVTDTKGGKHDGTFTTRIKGRGNSSWSSSAPQTSYDSKNSYRLKLDESQKFLGIGDSKNKDWVLNSCKFDASLLRNYIGYEMGRMLTGIDYSTECTWAHVYINGDYRGVYMVTEFIEVAKDRVDIDDKIEDADNGFLIELDMRGNNEGTLGVDYFYIDGYAEGISNPREWVIKSDFSLDPSTAVNQFEFIKNYMQKVHDAIENGTREEIEALIDIDSFVDMFICSEFSKDVDVNTASFYMYKPSGGKLHLTAPWDYDFGFGTYGEGTSFSGLLTNTSSGNQWFKALLTREWFVDLIIKRMNDLKPEFQKFVDNVLGVGFSLTSVADSNAMKWDLYANKYHPYVSGDVSLFLEDYEDHLLFLNTWMTWRWDLIIIELELIEF